MRRQRAGCDVLLLPGASPRQVNHSGSRAPPNRNRLGGRSLLDPTWDVQCRGQSPHRFCDHSRVQCALVLLWSSQCLLWLYLPLRNLQTKYRDAAERPPHQGVDGPRVSLFRSCACRHIQFPLGTPVRENAYGSHDHHVVLRRTMNTSAPRWFLAT